MKQLYFSLLLLAASIPVSAQLSSPKKIRGYSIQAEQDVFSGLLGLKNLDKDYSGGFKFEFYTDYLNNGIFPLFKNRREERSGQAPDYVNFNSLYIIGMGLTPNEEAITEVSPVTSQRPYASIIGIGRKRIAVFEDIDLCIESDFLLGIIGTHLPGNIRNFLRKNVTNRDHVNGWDNQVGKGGRLVGNYRLRGYVNPFALIDESATENAFRLFLEPELSFGNLFINTGLGVSITDRSAQSKGLSTATGSNRLHVLGDKGEAYSGGFLSHFNWEIYAKYQRVFHNTLLMGMPFQDNSVYTISEGEMSKNLFDIGGKILFNYYPNPFGRKNRHTTLFIELIFRSKEFSYHDTRIFGNVGITVFKLQKE
ncbi:MAG: DUF2219 family protein [Saprospiraceae bacterium]|nr:DUF2219 family protein [Saprospiraceae bacterium]